MGDFPQIFEAVALFLQRIGIVRPADQTDGAGLHFPRLSLALGRNQRALDCDRRTRCKLRQLLEGGTGRVDDHLKVFQAGAIVEFEKRKGLRIATGSHPAHDLNRILGARRAERFPNINTFHHAFDHRWTTHLGKPQPQTHDRNKMGNASPQPVNSVDLPARLSSPLRMTPENLSVLVLGAGGREHALVRACLESAAVKRVIAAPGNGGMASEVPCFPIHPEDSAAVCALAQAEGIDFVIVGPEAPLAAGVADALRAAGIPTYGPGAHGAHLEASKAACKDFFARYDIPTAAYALFTDSAPALASLATCNFPVVIKASGLAAGKGVLICETAAEAESAIRGMLDEAVFGDAGREIVIEEFLSGEEASIMVMVGGDDYVCLPVSQDHKRVGEGDTGLNTGGMGAYAPASLVDDALLATIRETVIEPTLAGFRAEGIDYRGTLYIGLMLTARGPQVLEFNVRFGDPECQILLPLCATDPVNLMFACATRTLQPSAVALKDAAALIVVLAAAGYPGAYPKGEAISFPETLPEGVQIIHAGTTRDPDGTIRTNGGRVLGVVAMAPTLAEARDRAYTVCAEVRWDHLQYRRDIAWREFARQA